MEITFASYNIRKAIGRDRRRDPDRILTVLRELDADVVALQEADRRFGRRASALPLAAIREHTPYDPVPLTARPDSIGWHGNVLLVRREMELVGASIVPLPVIEPRGAIQADLSLQGRTFRVAGMHLDLSGLRRRHQVRTVLDHVANGGDACPTVLMGDFNEWARRRGCFTEFGDEWQLLAPGHSYPAVSPVASLDRIVASPEWRILETGVHHSATASWASDHLPVWARLQLPKI